jgi:hypothetical protein
MWFLMALAGQAALAGVGWQFLLGPPSSAPSTQASAQLQLEQAGPEEGCSNGPCRPRPGAVPKPEPNQEVRQALAQGLTFSARKRDSAVSAAF